MAQREDICCSINSLRPSDTNMRRWTGSLLVQIIACSAPSHYLNQCWNIVNWTFRNKLQWNFNRNSSIFIKEIAFQNVVCKMVFILSRPQWVNLWNPGRLWFDFENVILKHISFISASICCEIAVMWMSLDLAYQVDIGSLHLLVNSSPSGQNGRHFTDDIFKFIFLNENLEFWFNFHWNLFLKAQLTINQHWFR